MIELSIPFFTNYFCFCQELTNNLLYNKQEFLNNQKFLFNIEYLHGSFPYVYFNGDVNSNYGTLLLYHQVCDFIKNIKTPLALDFSNSYLVTKDFTNMYIKILLTELQDSGHCIILSNIKLYEYIINNYPNFDYIFKLNNYQNQDNLNLNNYLLFTDITNNFIDQIPLNKQQILICNKCQNCTNILMCNKIEQKNQYNYSNKTVYNNNVCTYYQYNNFNDIYNEILKYPNNYHFKIDSPFHTNIISFYHWLYFNLFKEEYANFLWTKALKQVKKYE